MSAGLKPKANLAKTEIRKCESKIEAEQGATNETKESVEELQKEIEVLWKELGELGRRSKTTGSVRNAANRLASKATNRLSSNRSLSRKHRFALESPSFPAAQ